jgi:hypothetical protein
MTTAPDRSGTDRRRIVWITLAAFLFPAVLMIVGSTSHPEFAFLVIGLVLPTAWAIGRARDRVTREASDERAQEIQRHAAIFALRVLAVALVGVMAWIDLEHGIAAAGPYAMLLAVLWTSYVGAVLWRRWRGF